jgi:hypothetical protein
LLRKCLRPAKWYRPRNEVVIMPAQTDNAPAAEAATSPQSPQVIYVQAARQRQPVLWLIAGLLAIIAVALVFGGSSGSPFNLAMAQSVPNIAGAEGARGIYAFTGQLSARTYGLFMVDVDSGTVWCYEIQRTPGTGNKGDQTQLKLVAARSWLFDRYLEEFNTGEPIPSEVKDMIQAQRAGRSPTTKPAGGKG